MAFTKEEYVLKLSACVNEKNSYLKDILKITKNQSEIIDKDDYEELNRTFDEKQRKLDAISKSDDEFEGYFKGFKIQLGINSLDEISRFNIFGVSQLKALVEDTYAIMKDIYDYEMNNNKKANDAMEQVKGQLKNISSNKTVVKAYGGGFKESSSYFIDRKK